MCLLLESIKIANNIPQNLGWHQHRLEASRREIFGTSGPAISLRAALNVAGLDPSLTYKARVEYGRDIRKVEIGPYVVRPVTCIKVVEVGKLDYSHKYADRSAIDFFFKKRGSADDILMTENGYLTDCSYSNICLWDGFRWCTPAKPLLRGTKRAQLLKSGQLVEQRIRVEDLKAFKSLTLINAMLDPGAVVLPISQLIY